MTARLYRAVIEHSGKPKTLEVIATGSKERCAGALDAWKALPTTPDDPANPDVGLIVVEVAQ